MTTLQKFYIGAAVATVIAIGIIVGSTLSDHRIRKLETAMLEARSSAAKSEKASAEAERKASEYRAKIEYLEQQFVAVRTMARRQDEKLEKQNTNTRTARADVERAKRTSTTRTGADDLCTKLAELGHPC